MITHLESIVMALIRLLAQVAGIEIFPDRYKTICCDDTLLARRINAAFLVALAGKAHNESNRARAFLEAVLDAPDWTEIATFYRTGIDKIQSEIEETDRINPLFAGQVADVAEWLSAAKEIRFAGDALERIWKISCPEAVGITGNIESLVKILRKKRTVSVEKLNKRPIENPARQVLFTANASFTIPLEETSLDEIPLTGKAVKKLALAIRGQRRFWSYQPVPLGLPPEQNEILQGLQNLDRTMEFERNRGNVSETDRLSCLISVSGTHDELAGISRDLLRDEIARCGGLRKIDVYAFTEEEVRRIVDEVLAPAAIRYLKRDDAAESLAVLGIDGAKGRHFSFLKSMGAFWQVCIDGAIRGTFNLALDQTFPEEELVRESNRSAFEHLMTPLWGATGRDKDGRMLELGMIAGALVNADDIGKGLFTPHVPVPQGPRRIEEYLFFSTLPQALSAEAEMTARYEPGGIDGVSSCLQRVHVTSGATGILVEHLRRHRPFTPSFIDRAEDQAYLLSAMTQPEPRLAYVHEPGLVMRHDIDLFADKKSETSRIDKLVSDYIRTLHFSAYAEALAGGDISAVKSFLNPYTGAYISPIPVTLTYLRFAMKAASFYAEGKDNQGFEFIRQGASRIAAALKLTSGKNAALKDILSKERQGWDLYYDTLDAIEKALAAQESIALDLREKARKIIKDCLITEYK